MIYEIEHLTNLPSFAALLLQNHQTHKQFALYGQMGAGKTTLIKELCLQLGVVQTVTSPTFALVNEYTTQTGESVFHFDFYRIKTIEELFDLGYEDYLYSNSWCFIEWPEKAEEIIPSHFIKVYITVTPSGSRCIETKSQ